ncbi:MAG: UDP-glucose 4-epimerase GalE [Burkholderiaceae bacterium]|nr:UDP-glucose 4-epimerase GalE [Burkholderiaceae bacterium]
MRTCSLFPPTIVTASRKHTSVLVTGGTGYIGSHAIVQLLDRHVQTVVLDNLSNSHRVVLDRIAQITGKRPVFVEGDIRDKALLAGIFRDHPIRAVIHFAGLKAVGESAEKPFEYYENNVSGSLTLFQEMARAGVYTLIFSSSATVYGDPGYARLREDTPLAPVNVYGRTKLMVEDILRAAKEAERRWKIALLRYFNPVGAHPSGLIGEDPMGIPNNLMPFIAQVAQGRRAQLAVFGNDYPTPDGTGVRDYIHVQDLARAHLAALDALDKESAGLVTLNLGTGRPYSVLEVVAAFEKAAGRPVPYRIAPRRQGDVAQCYADPALANQVLGWRAEYDMTRMCEDMWRWQKNNPSGYA